MITHSTKETEQQKEQWGWGVGVGGDREVGGEAGGQNLKKWGRQYRGVFIK